MTEQQKISYALGMNIMGNLAELPIEIDVESVISAIKDVSAEKETALKVEEYHKYMQEFQKKVQEAGQQAVAKAAENNKKAGAEFLAENAKKEGVKVTPSGLQYRVITEGSGAKPSASSKVKVHYTGKLTDGTVFDSSVQRGEPIDFALNQVIPGWTEGVQLMTPGSKYEFVIPSDLAYGDRGAGNAIPPGATLVFEVELLAVL
ncbi:MAG: FKBP-type peptidyl-prolyl cis-trans isomerase [Lentisphaeria bacterium]|nr:FKBP-type peptidyl-prolyl cis-trans isomerase [Lentisphaeria bacterium]MBO7153173.1 FKBP-type peptidyl-prolyl cis-trans isomerase [Lentisphaeria bacterium]MBR2632863.1 FKBP-type peptidyl-prolyl cis-trans isomerase [Lentisphaeria bacterium]